MANLSPREVERLNQTFMGFSMGFISMEAALKELGTTMEQAAASLHNFHEKYAMRTWTNPTELEFKRLETDALPTILNRLFNFDPKLTFSLVEAYRCKSLSMLIANCLEIELVKERLYQRKGACSNWDNVSNVLDVYDDASTWHFKLAVPEPEKQPDEWWLWAEVKEWPKL